MKKHNLSLLLRSTHLKFGIIAAALATLALMVGLSAYLVTSTEEPYTPTFRTATGEEFGLSISGRPYEDDVVYPGEEITLNPTVSSTTPMYVFAEVSLGGLELGTLSDDWHLLSSDEEAGTSLYYHGENSNVTMLSGSSTIFSTVTVPTSVNTDSKFKPSVVAYGIQTDGITGRPDQIWQMIVTQNGGAGE